MASCLPLVAQMPIFLVMFRVLHKLTEKGSDGTFDPSYIDKTSKLYKSLDHKTEMLSFGLDLAKRPINVIQDSPGKGIIYALLVILLGGLYFVQQRMVASRTPATGMSPGQQKLMQYLPVGFAFFQLFFPVGLVIYYITQTLVRIGQQQYITHRFYKGHDSLGRQAQAAGAKAREMAKADGGGTGLMASLRQEAQSQKSARDDKTPSKGGASKPAAASSKRTTPPKSRPTPNRSARPAPPNRPKPTGNSRHTKPSKP
jgi:YidC/Oxa1 family membrane protein insertase